MNAGKSVKNNDHHLLLGELEDFITGSTIADTHDERFRQKIAKILVKECGFEKTEIKKDIVQIVEAGRKRGSIKIDFLVEVDGKTVMLVKYNPGSIVTRRQSCIAMSRIAAPYQIPMAVMTNGEEAEVIDPVDKKVIRMGLDSLPDKNELKKLMSVCSFASVTREMFDMASRIVYAFEVDGACPCDSDVCEL